MIEHLLFLYLRTVLNRSWDELMHATHEPARMQSARLMDILSRNQETVFGKQHLFSRIRSVEQFRERVPVRTYELFEPYILRIRLGEKMVLTREQPHLFGRTSGTTGEPKFIPITPSFYEEFSKTQKMWQRKLLEDHRPMARGKILSVMGAEIDGYTECGIPYGAVSGHSYRMQYPLTQNRYAVPYDVMCLKDFDAKYYLVIRLALEQNVTAIAALNPSTILLLMKKLNQHAASFARDLADATIPHDLPVPSCLRRQLAERLSPNPERCRRLEKLAAQSGPIKATDLWSELALVATWQGGALGFFINQFPQYFPGVPIRDMGLVATEGYFSIPLCSDTADGLLGISGHFFEFFEVAEGGSRCDTPLGAEEVEIGKDYCIVVTTSGGLYRYDIGDIVTVTGFFNNTPLIAFKQKAGNTVSITGEKVTEAQVTEAMKLSVTALSVPVEGFLLALQLGEPPCYRLVVETAEHDEHALLNLLTQFEHHLRLKNIEYAQKRDSQRLGKPKLCLVENGCFEFYRKSRMALGASDAQYKVSHLAKNLEQFSDFRYITEVELPSVAGRST